MALSNTLLRATFAALVPLLAACNQTAQAPAPDASTSAGSGAVAAIMEAERTRAANQVTSRALGIASSFDPTGLSGYAVSAVEEAQERALEAKYDRIDQEVEKALAQAEAAQAMSEEMAQDRPAAQKPKARKTR